MFNFFKKNDSNVDKLYNKILYLSRNKFFFVNLNLSDTFQNRIYLIFIHSAFIFLKIKHNENNLSYKKFYQKSFDFMINRIELDMREIGHGDVTINKNMKFLVTNFYNILIKFEKYGSLNTEEKFFLFNSYLVYKSQIKQNINYELVKYFDKYHSFCLDLTTDSVLMGDLKFNYKQMLK